MDIRKKTPREHVLDRGSVWLGPNEFVDEEMWLVDQSSFTKELVKYNPALLKIIDELLVNCVDQCRRNIIQKHDKTKWLKNIKLTLYDDNSISVFNDGSGIDIEMDPKENVYKPELVFGHLMTSTNYDDTEKRTWGGMNGLGAKCSNIYSEWFIVETGWNGLGYKQRFTNNMSKIKEPKLSKNNKEFVKITFMPDYKRFGMTTLDDTFKRILEKRMYDLIPCVPEHVSISFNGKKLPIQKFKRYIQMYDSKCIVEQVNDRWAIGCCLSRDDKFEQVSFVNGIVTPLGGTHVNYVTNQIVKQISNKMSKNMNIKPVYIKNSLMVFVVALIENPTFTSQIKENLKTTQSKFGSTCTVSKDFVDKVVKLGLVNKLKAIGETKHVESLESTTTKKRTIDGIPKLDDANKAGTKYSYKCTLIITEGDSAKTLAVGGLSVIGRDYYGAFPIKGKFMNVRDATKKSLETCVEFNNIKKIIGLNHNLKYKTDDEFKKLRYGSILLMTDQDLDGSHIKGLLINMFEMYWPELIKRDFIKHMITPIVKASKGKRMIPFYTVQEYNEFKKKEQGWKYKYYKGLGTSTPSEVKEYFKQYANLVNQFDWEKESHNSVDLAFNKKRADDRKQWILDAIKDPCVLDYTKSVNISDFINKDLVHFSIADTIRSIPSLCDGFKPSQRKVLFTLLNNGSHETKVSQLAGKISEKTAYHHGQVSLEGCIVNMAQDFPGSNNINFLSPCGQFGSRQQNGKDAASSRYIFTKLESITKEIFNTHDSVLLDYLDDDGISIEPRYFVPIIPTILVNGACGMGTGFSTSIPCFNPKDVIHNLKCLIKGTDDFVEFIPWYRGFKGKIEKMQDKFLCSGLWEVNNNIMTVTELPISTSIQSFKELLNKLIEQGIVKTFTQENTRDENDVNFKIELVQKLNDVSCFKLTETINITNMHLFDEYGKIQKYKTPMEILKAFYKVRSLFYKERKKYLITKYNNDVCILESKIRFIYMICKNELVVFKKKKQVVEKELDQLKFPMLDGSFNYLLDIKVSHFTLEKIQELEKTRETLTQELSKIKGMTSKMLWMADLKILKDK